MTPLLSRRDIDFILFELLDVDELLERSEFAEHSHETIEAILDLSETVAQDHFASHFREADLHEPQFIDGQARTLPEAGAALKLFAELGFVGASMPSSVGGLDLPRCVADASFAWFQAANVATASYPLLTKGCANLLLAHGTQEQVREFVEPMVTGRYFGTMCLSEPDAGSSLADVRTIARRTPNGYRLFGTKMWISGGDQDISENIIHLVLARTASPTDGVHGLSLFIVPKVLSSGERNDVALVGLNHKMGSRGTTNTVINFGEGRHRPSGSEGAVGYLIGDEGRGLEYMFHMMNEARVGVGLSAAALGYTGFLQSVEYASTRRQGRPRDARPTDAPVPIIEHADVSRMLLAQKSFAEGGLALGLLCSRLIDDERTAPSQTERAGASDLLDVLTPIAKSWPARWCLEANHLAIQVHGGYGYSTDFNVEQLYRDNRLNMIHEGTEGIQAIDLLGRKVTLNEGNGFNLLLERMSAVTARAQEHDSLKEMSATLDALIARLRLVTSTLVAVSDKSRRLANATLYLDTLGHVVVGHILLDMATRSNGRSDGFHKGKVQSARYFFGYELPRVNATLDLLERGDNTTVDMQADWFVG